MEGKRMRNGTGFRIVRPARPSNQALFIAGPLLTVLAIAVVLAGGGHFDSKSALQRSWERVVASEGHGLSVVPFSFAEMGDVVIDGKALFDGARALALTGAAPHSGQLKTLLGRQLPILAEIITNDGQWVVVAPQGEEAKVACRDPLFPSSEEELLSCPMLSGAPDDRVGDVESSGARKDARGGAMIGRTLRSL